MTTKNLAILAAAAAVAGAAAYFTGGSRNKAPALTGKSVVPAFEIADVASVEIGDAIRLAAGDGGWTIATMQDYPADTQKIGENLMKLQELKVGQVARGRDLGERTEVALKDASGNLLASVTLGDRHEKWGHGRYADMNGTTVLVSDTLDAFGDDPKRWCSTKIIDSPYVSFKELADPSLDEATLGFATGAVATVTIGDATNRVATVGAAVADGTDRYLRIDGEKWVFIVPKYAADALLPKPPPEEPKDEEPAEDPPAEPPEEPSSEQ
ncbi:MAG: DUF4340 domain-containing protein [Kiritimatiellae bacterium]|nr:DUF4340 domain-containing protein [Kiritimatiellia bacterium]